MSGATPAPISGTANFFYALAVRSQLAADFETAAKQFQFALEHAPSHVDLRFRRASCLQSAGQFEAAVREYEDLLAIDASLASVRNNLGNAYASLDRLPEALSSLQTVVVLEPDYADGHANLGNILARLGRYDEAEATLKRALELNPAVFSYWYNLANVLQSVHRLDEAIAHYQRAIELDDSFAGCFNNLGNAYRSLGRYTEAVSAFEAAIACEPNNAATYANFGGLVSDAGELRRANTYYDKALALDDECTSAFSNKLYLMNYVGDEPVVEILAASRAWGERFARSRSSREARPRAGAAPKAHGLRVGFVSADFRRHSVAYFFEALLEGNKDNKFEIFCYANLSQEDDVSARIRQKCQRWRSIARLTDTQVAELVRQDSIDVLVDLSGHTSGNRLPVFARRPAPVQVTWLGYPNTIGVLDIDYRLTDSVADPQANDSHHSETLWRLPSTFICYRPDPTAPPVASSPFLKNGHLSFGSFNNLSKITDTVISTWANLLNAVPRSILITKSKMFVDDAVRNRFCEKFSRLGIASSRLRLVDRDASFEDHMQRYNEIDIALDTFPYNGTTTTCEALWMGVPVLGLRGSTHRSRVTLSIESQLGLGRFVANDERELLAVADELSRSPEQLAQQRCGLRDQMMASSLCDFSSFAADMEQAFRRMVAGSEGADSGRTTHFLD